MTNTYVDPSFTITELLRRSSARGGPGALSILLYKVLVEIPGCFLQEALLLQMSKDPHKHEELYYHFERFRRCCEQTLSDDEMLALERELLLQEMARTTGRYAHL
jgi:hypothetical protein